MLPYRKRLAIYQILFLILVSALLIFGALNLWNYGASKGIKIGYGFLNSEAGFAISETFPLTRSLTVNMTVVGLIGALTLKRWKTQLRLGFLGACVVAGLSWDLIHGFPAPLATFFESSDSYLTALTTGLMNTVKVAICGIALSVLLGTILGIARTSSYVALNSMVQSYIRIVRGAPLLLQIVFWYVVVLNVFPKVESGWNFFQWIYLNNRGLSLPMPTFADGMFHWDRPALTFNDSNIAGGMTLSPEFLALTLGLTLYNASYVAEIVRAAIQSIHKGQREAAQSLGMNSFLILKKIILPQALKIMRPPLASQCLNLTKNSSLAVAIGYPDLVAVGGTVMNQSGHTFEVIFIWMAFYLAASLFVSLLVNTKSLAVSETP